MSLLQLASSLKTPADGDALVEYIFNEGTSVEDKFRGQKVYGERTQKTELDISQDQYLAKYFNLEVRKSVFASGSCAGRQVKLSASAAILKSAFQRRYASNQLPNNNPNKEQFKPMTAYHGTKDLHTANLIVNSGFQQSYQTIRGKGVYFYVAADYERAEDYALNSGGNEGGIVLEVTIFSAITNKDNKPRRDKLTFQFQNVLVVKNPLVIFPKATYTPGDKHRNSKGMKEWQSFTGAVYQRKLD